MALVDPACFLGLSPQERSQQLYEALYTWAGDDTLTDPECFLGLSPEEQGMAMVEAVASGSAFTGINPVREGLVAEYDPASLTVVGDGNSIAVAWPDTSGSGNNLPAPTADQQAYFTYHENGWGSRPVVRMSSDATSWGQAPMQAGDFSLVCVWHRRPAELVGTRRVISCRNWDDFQDLVQYGYQTSGMLAVGPSTRYSTEKIDDLMLLVITCEGDSWTVYHGDTVFSTFTYAATANRGGFVLGSAYGETGAVDFGYWGVYDRALTQAEATRLARSSGAYFDTTSVALVGNSHYAGTGATAGHGFYDQIRGMLDGEGKDHWLILPNYYEGRTGTSMATTELTGVGQHSIDFTFNSFHRRVLAFVTEMTNDQTGDNTNGQIAENILIVMERLKDKGAHAVFDPERNRYTDSGSYTASAEGIRNALVMAQPSRYSSNLFTPPDARFNTPGIHGDPAWFSDSVHFNDAGYDAYFTDYIAPKITAVLAP